MTPIERSLYAMTRFEMDDAVLIAGELEGTVTGIKVTSSGEDEYRVFFFDGSGTPTERWFRDSLLEPVDEPDDSNVICFDCAKAAREARNATKH